MKPLPHIHTPTWTGKAILFDLDGVLVDTMPIHRQAFLDALGHIGVFLSPEEHDARLAGLPTRVKLQALGLEPDEIGEVIAAKQEATCRLIEKRVTVDTRKCDMLRDLSRDGYALGVVSNAIHATVTRVLQLANLVWPMAVVLSNEHVTRPKPAPDPWIIAMYELGARPEHTLIVEDSPPGIESARASGAHVLEVSGVADVTYERVKAAAP